MTRGRNKVAWKLLLIGLLAIGAVWIWLRTQTKSPNDVVIPGGGGRSLHELAAALEAIEAREAETDRTVWAKERLAERCGSVLDQLWDMVNASTNKLGAIGAFPVGEMVVGSYDASQSLRHGVRVMQPSASGRAWAPEQWREFVSTRQREGWSLQQLEFRHLRFDAEPDGLPKQSTFYFSAHVSNDALAERAIMEGDLVIDWAPVRSAEEFPTVKRIDATRLVIKSRNGAPGFDLMFVEEVVPMERSFFIDPLILYDLDGDGRSEIILAAANRVYRRRDANRLEPELLCRQPPGLIFNGMIADLDGDGNADFLCAKFEGLMLFRGSANGTFDEPGQLVWRANPRLKYGQVLTCGDIDGDGDLDVWFGQYRVPYERGQMPTPYFDANDGNPSFLLRNDGQAYFADVTVEAGLEAKRHRRSYSGSLVDLDLDGDLDLMVINDFAGIDLFANDGRGRFQDVTRAWISEPRAFGMAHAVADFNADGRSDLLMIGMNAPTADRLHHLNLRREGIQSDAPAQAAMTMGNRLFVSGQDGPPYRQTALNDSIARSGWSWGCSAFDFDNDGYLDVYIANGHETKESVREYEPEFWLHDIYVGNSKDDVVVAAYFGAKHGRTRARGYSYGGWEKNRLYWNQRGDSFVEIGHLMGVALEADSRNVVADDLDGDGKLDLLVTTFEVWPERRQTLRVYRNTLGTTGNWIGFRFREQGKGVSPVGVRINAHHAGGTLTRQVLNGDSHRSQHANTVHFGLGTIGRLESVDFRWQNGRTHRIVQPAVNSYLDIALPDR